MDFVLILAGLAMLFFGGEGLVRGAVAIAERQRISKLAIGLTIVGMGTSFPELLVSVRAALAGAPDIAVGNVVGSNLSNILVILGTAALVAPITGWNGNVRRDTLFGVAAAFGVLLLGFYGSVPRIAGLVMVAALVFYLRFAYQQGKSDPPAVVEHFEEEVPHAMTTRAALFWVFGGLLLLFAGAEALVTGAVTIARDFGISERVIGLTIVAIGTSLPELAASLAAALRGHSDVAIGNVAGSNVFNILGILGVTSIVQPMTIAPGIANVDIPLMAAAMVALAVMMFRLTALSRKVGIALLTAYAAYVALLIS